MKKITDYTNQKFWKLTALKFIERKDRKTYWLCKCDCGNEVIKPIVYVKRGDIKSCGCLLFLNTKKLNRTKHNMSNTRIYNIWNKMKRRCYLPTYKRHKSYYDKNIKVCDEWLDEENGFMNFYNWSIENGYKDNLTIDRINNNGNYEPNNCRWATIKEQNNNRSNNIKIQYKGKEWSLMGLSEEYNINVNTLYGRIKKGWNIEKALFCPKWRRDNN